MPLLALTAINVVGVKSGVRTAVFLAVSKTIPLLLFIGVGLFVAKPSLALGGTVPAGGFKNLGEAALLLLFAYAGFENTAAPAGEFKNPRRDVPFALIYVVDDRADEAVEGRPTDLGEDDLLRKVTRLADEDAAGLRHAFDDQRMRHDRKRRVEVVQMLLGQRDVLDRRRRLPAGELGEPVDPNPTHK